MYLKVGAGYRGRGESEYPKYQCPNLLNPLVRRRHLFGYFTICNLGSLYKGIMTKYLYNSLMSPIILIDDALHNNQSR